MSDKKKNLTGLQESAIILSDDEKRIIKNIQRHAKKHTNDDIAVIFNVCDGELKRGTLCTGHNRTIRI